MKIKKKKKKKKKEVNIVNVKFLNFNKDFIKSHIN